MEQWVPDGEEVQQETTGEIGIEELMTHRSCRKYMVYREGSHEIKAGRRQRERQLLGHMPFLGVCVWRALGFSAKARKPKRAGIC